MSRSFFGSLKGPRPECKCSGFLAACAWHLAPCPGGRPSTMAATGTAQAATRLRSLALFVCFGKEVKRKKGLVAGWRAWVSGCFTTCPLSKGLPRKCRASAFGCNRRAVDCVAAARASARTLRFVDKLSYRYSCRCTDGPCRSLLELPCTYSLMSNQARKHWDSTLKFWKSRIVEC